MKQKFFVFSMGLTVLGAITFSCSNQEDVVPTSDDLSIKSQVPRRKVSGEQWINTHNTNIYNNFEHGQDECCLVALVKMKQKKMTNGNFRENETAQNYYDNAKNIAKELSEKDSNGNPTYTGGKMPLDLFLKVGQKLNLIKERREFDNNNDKREFFSDKKNDPKVILIDVRNKETGKMESHVANVTQINREKGTLSCSGISGEISFNEVKSVWK